MSIKGDYTINNRNLKDVTLKVELVSSKFKLLPYQDRDNGEIYLPIEFEIDIDIENEIKRLIYESIKGNNYYGLTYKGDVWKSKQAIYIKPFIKRKGVICLLVKSIVKMEANS